VDSQQGCDPFKCYQLSYIIACEYAMKNKDNEYAMENKDISVK
jgi:hypothetical protein